MNMNVSLYAQGLGIDLYHEYKAADAAKKLRVGINALNAAANDNELPCIQTGKKRRVYLGVDLIQWKLSKRTESASTISPKIAVGDGVVVGMTSKISSENLQALAHQTFQAPSKS